MLAALVAIAAGIVAAGEAVAGADNTVVAAAGKAVVAVAVACTEAADNVVCWEPAGSVADIGLIGHAVVVGQTVDSVVSLVVDSTFVDSAVVVVGSIFVDLAAAAAVMDSFVAIHQQSSDPAGNCSVVVNFAAVAAAEDNNIVADSAARCEGEFLGYFEYIHALHYSVQTADLLEFEVAAVCLIAVEHMHRFAAAHSAQAMQDYRLGTFEQKPLDTDQKFGQPVDPLCQSKPGIDMDSLALQPFVYWQFQQQLTVDELAIVEIEKIERNTSEASSLYYLQFERMQH